RQQIDLLKNQLDDAKNRESFYQNQIETMQRLLEAPKTNTTQSDDPKLTQAESTVEEKEDVIAMPPKESEVIGNKRIPVPEHIEPELEKRGFWSRFFKPYG
ncbi:DNA-binding protein, partial [Acinetobacter indicus]|nr:DNA-binding protein [Acinetobacter indicus]